MAAENTINTTGRRKTAVANVTMVHGTGVIRVNKRDFQSYFPVEAQRNFIVQPLKLAGVLDKYNIKATCSGGGTVGQAGAMRHAIARSLVQADPSLREVIKASGCLTRDPRMKERKKPGQPGARKRFQFSKR